MAGQRQKQISGNRDCRPIRPGAYHLATPGRARNPRANRRPHPALSPAPVAKVPGAGNHPVCLLQPHPRPLGVFPNELTDGTHRQHRLHPRPRHPLGQLPDCHLPSTCGLGAAGLPPAHPPGSVLCCCTQGPQGPATQQPHRGRSHTTGPRGPRSSRPHPRVQHDSQLLTAGDSSG